MSKTRDTGYLNNVVKVSDTGNITFVSGSTTLLAISSSGAVTTTGVISGSNALSASYAATASFVTLSQTASFVANAQSASNAVNAQTASSADNFLTRGTLTAQTIVVQTITSSVDFVTGSTKFGSQLDNTHQFTGSMAITGALNVNAGTTTVGVLSGSGANFSSALTVNGTGTFNSSANQFFVLNSTYVGGGLMALQASGTNYGYIGCSNSLLSGTTNDFAILSRAGTLELGANNARGLIFSTTNAATFSSTLSAFDTIKVSGSGAYFTIYDTQASSKNWAIRAGHDAVGDLAIRQSNSSGGDPVSAGTTRLYINASGSVGFAVTPAAQNGGTLAGSVEMGGILRIQGGTGRYFTTGDGLELTKTGIYSYNRGTSAYNDLNINDTLLVKGNNAGVGIGTTNPSVKLEVLDTSTSSGEVARFQRNIDQSNEYAYIRIGNGTYPGYVGSMLATSDIAYLSMSPNPTDGKALIVNSAGKVGIGVTNPANALQVNITSNSTSSFLDDSHPLLLKNTSTTNNTYVGLYLGCNSGVGVTIDALYPSASSSSEGILRFNTRNSSGTLAERMRITSDGSLLVNSTSVVGSLSKLNVHGPNAGPTFSNDTQGQQTLLLWNKATSGDNLWAEFHAGSTLGTKGSIDYNRASNVTRFNTSSDANLKNIIGYSDRKKSIDILNSTKIREYSWKDDVTNKVQIGVIAQELYKTYKGAVSEGSNDELFGTDEYKTWSVDKTAFTFHLIAGWQEHEKIIKELKSENDSLKEILQRNNIV